MKTTVLLTGGSGFLGSRIARILLNDTDYDIVAIVRGTTHEDAVRRITRLWVDWPDAVSEIGGRVRVLRGDLCDPLIGLDREAYRQLVGSVTHIIHSAAELDLDGPIEGLRRVNVGGTAHLLELAHAANLDHGLIRFSHVSTAYVAGGRTGEVAEEDLSDDHGFSNSYEQTKFEGERLVRSNMASLPISVFRPGMVVGDSETGEIQTFNTVYVPLRLYLSGKLKLIPAKSEMPLNLVPVDYVAQSIAQLTFIPQAVGRTFHLTVDSRYLPSAREVLDITRDWAAINLGTELPAARFVPFERLATLIERRLLTIPACLVSYFNENRRYRRDNVDGLLGSYAPDWAVILPHLLDYATARGFLKHTGRTVHEQVVTRLQSRRIPFRVHDLSADGRLRLRSGEEMCAEIRAARRSLEALGVGPRDHVGLVGLNSTRYLSVDLAIGLAGAVSVPLYYTSPPAEIETIVRASGVRLLFVGSERLLASLEDSALEIPLISFWSGPSAKGSSDRVMSWDAFLALAVPTPIGAARTNGEREKLAELDSPVDFHDDATVRFTSGTTGEPKGAAFRHDQLAWLAQTVVSLFPWKARISPARYLSFLPMNHVVEGILGIYSPAYMPAPVDIYFLDDLRALPRALTKIRPTVFFSVPRFYEKVWDSFSTSFAGRLYRATGPRFRRLARPAIRLALLWSSGLDRCVQLIVGSAPCSDLLLRSFKELGIEIHNAYGLTEAPLITLNRLGANRIGTVGTPLPETELQIASDGELLVRGPQVAGGGWLATGDFGSVEASGRLTIIGRKKDILVTSYGKNIQASKIEAMLRGIPGVVEAVVVGDNRPALCAYLWMAETRPTPGELSSLDSAIEAMNERLSHPERLKRWAVLAEKPSIQNSELTGNLKVKRSAVTTHRTSVAVVLYNDMAEVPARPTLDLERLGIIHLGRQARECA